MIRALIRKTWDERANLSAHAAIWLLVVSQFVFLPYADDRWIFPKLTAMCVAVFFAALAPASGRLPAFFTPVVLAGLGILLLDVGVSADFGAQLLGRDPRYEGLVAVPVYAAAIWAGARMLGPGATQGHRRSFVVALACGAIATAVVAVSQRTPLTLIPTDSARPGSLLANATNLGVIMVVVAVMLVPSALAGVRQFVAAVKIGTRLQATPRRIAHAVSIALILAGLASAVLSFVLSASRAAFLAVAVSGVVGLAVIITDRVRSGRRIVRPVLLPATIAVAIVVVVSLCVPMTRSRLLGTSNFALKTVSDRFDIYESTMRIVADHPWTGLGANGFIEVAPKYLNANWYASVGGDVTLDSPHNWVMQVLVIGGLPLFAWALLTIALCVRQLCALLLSQPISTRSQGRRKKLVGSYQGTSAVTMTSDRWWAHIGPEQRALQLSAGVALAGYLAALLTHFTSADNTLLAGVLVGLALSRPMPARGAIERMSLLSQAFSRVRSPRLRRRCQRLKHAAERPLRPALDGGISRVIVLAALLIWSVWMGVNAAAEQPLRTAQLAISQTNYARAEREYAKAEAMRPWDVDLPYKAARRYAGKAAAGDPVAAQLTVDWSRRALAEVPDMGRAKRTLAIGLEHVGDVRGAYAVLDELACDIPGNPSVQEQRSRVGELIAAQTH
ncbi:O-antigen ligase family protein [Pseudoclavibacter sp. 13-3]|uniref:O-antigen ligase family protein n=1 Tax=Pseudoclavibacter sp. 13-3 TaxID=2901228 RepID=UPI001E4FA046|nr:O-antigen ligase family protein [Pseudoclavibacter sp. 13-3]MCD7101103.1 O-antigen ligase family protein [Pseudoclavibacter sp. 13-3]